MAMIIKNNVSAQMALGELNKNNNKLSKSLQKVASGMKINGAADDASGYAISERMQVQIRGLAQDIDNTQNAISLLRTAEGAASSTVDILKTLKEKAINAANDTNTDADRATIQKEVDQSIDQLNDNAAVTFNGKTLFDGSADIAEDVKQTIIKALNSEWIARSLDMSREAYGLTFGDDFATVRDIDLVFKDEPGSNALASVSWSTNSEGKATKMHLNVNLAFYSTLDPTDVNGKSATSGASYLDRTIAHEMVHAVMAANIDNFNNMPLFIAEGAAEFVHGIDDERRSSLASLSRSTISSVFSSGGTAGTSDPYTVGYAFLHYINANGGHEDAMKRFMSILNEKGGGALDEAIAGATKGKFTTLQSAKDAFLADFDRVVTNGGGSNNDFFKKYCDMDLDNLRDTGSVKGSKAWGGDEEDAENVVLEGKSTRFWYYPSGRYSTIDNLTVDWGEFNRPDSGFRFQVGTKANQVIKAAFSDIHAEALGLRSDEGETVQLTTRANAKRAITIFDNAIQKVLDQQTTIGAIQSRLEYTARNLTTAHENVTSSESVLRDADMAKEMTEYTKANVLTQAAQSMLAQANQNSSGVLSLLQ